MKFRALSALESELLETATLGNINWCEERFTLDDVRENELFAHYTRLQPNRGDFGIVAEDACIQTGVVWALFLPQSNPGFGFIDETTPELSLWVAPHARGCGLGRQLLRAIVAEARCRELLQLSLSVEADNIAKSLYLAEGFFDVAGREHDGVMVKSLAT